MTEWRNDWRTDGALRTCGIALCTVSFAAFRALLALRSANGHLPPGALPFGLVWIGLACACSGGVLTVLGHHVFDEVEIGASRYRMDPLTIDPERLDPAEGEIGKTDKIDAAPQGSPALLTTMAAAAMPQTGTQSTTGNNADRIISIIGG